MCTATDSYHLVCPDACAGLPSMKIAVCSFSQVFDHASARHAVRDGAAWGRHSRSHALPLLHLFRVRDATFNCKRLLECCAAHSRSERSFSVVSTNAIAFPMTDLYSSTGALCLCSDFAHLCVVRAAAGLGFGLVHCVLMYGSILGSALGPGTVFSPHCSQFSTFVVSGSRVHASTQLPLAYLALLSAFNSLFFGLLHVFWVRHRCTLCRADDTERR